MCYTNWCIKNNIPVCYESYLAYLVYVSIMNRPIEHDSKRRRLA